MKDKRKKWTEKQDWYLDNLTYFTDDALSIITRKSINEIQQRRYYKKIVLEIKRKSGILKSK